MSDSRMEDVISRYDSVANGYDEVYSSELNLSEDRVLFGELGKRALGKVLDVGAGTGLLLNHLSGQVESSDYLGVEPSGGMITVFKENYPDYRVIQSTFEDFDISTERYDSVFAIYGVVAYIDKQYYGRFKELLKPNGKYVVMALNEGYTPPFEDDDSTHSQDLDALRLALGDDVKEIPYGFNETIFTNIDDMPTDLYDRVTARKNETLQ